MNDLFLGALHNVCARIVENL